MDYPELVRRSFANGYDVAPEDANLIDIHNYRVRYHNGHTIPEDKLSLLRPDDHEKCYVNGHDPICPIIKSARLIQNRYRHGHDLPESQLHILQDGDYGDRFAAGFDIPEDRLSKVSDRNIIKRFVAGYEMPHHMLSRLRLNTKCYSKYVCRRFKESGDCEPGLEHMLTDDNLRYAYSYGINLPKTENVLTTFFVYWREKRGYCPEQIDYRVSYRRGYKVPLIIEEKMDARDRDIHFNYRLTMAIHGKFTALERRSAADFEEVTGKHAPDYLKILDPTGDVILCTGFDDPELNQVNIGELFDQLHVPLWDLHQVGEVCGTLYAKPR